MRGSLNQVRWNFENAHHRVGLPDKTSPQPPGGEGRHPGSSSCRKFQHKESPAHVPVETGRQGLPADSKVVKHNMGEQILLQRSHKTMRLLTQKQK